MYVVLEYRLGGDHFVEQDAKPVALRCVGIDDRERNTKVGSTDIEFALDAGERAAVVGRHRAAEDHHAGIVRHVLGQLAAAPLACAQRLDLAPLGVTDCGA